MAVEVLAVVMEGLLVVLMEMVMQGSVLQDLGWVDTVVRVLVLQAVVKEVDLLLGILILRSVVDMTVDLGKVDYLVLCLGYLICVLV